ncbi:MAG: glycosyltransferase [Lachnospiraceae bacterium]|nr:glycosyltransferase [Lachnospiraceae bacterium]
MIKLAILFQEDEIEHKDLSHPELGNPGVGGTAFCFLLLMKYLKEFTDTVDFTVYQTKENQLPADKVVKVASVEEAAKRAVEDGNEIMLIRNHQTDETYEILQKHSLKYIVWMHNKLTIGEIHLLYQWDDVKRIICVGKEMYDYYLDDVIISKMDVIRNMFVPPKEEQVRGDEYPLNVTYTGSLTYDKNFHLLAAVWKDILKSVPMAQLHVIGSGRLYDQNGIMGRMGLADKEYEDLFLPYLCDENGELLPSVIFHGIMGEEKYDIYKKSAVGVVNPMATETFCLSAIEKEACGIPVVSRRKNGLLDTVQSGKTGILYKNVKKLAPTIIDLLLDREKNIRMGHEAAKFARTCFLPEKVMEEWIRVFTEVHQGEAAVYKKPTANPDNNGKWIRRIFHGIHSIPFCRKVPSIHEIQKK